MNDKIIKLLKKWGKSVSAIILGGLSILLMLVCFNINTEKTMENFVRSNMEETNQAAIMSLNHNFNAFVDLLEQQAKIFSLMEQPEDQEILNALIKFAGEEEYKNTAIITFDGKVYSSVRGITQVKEGDVLPNLLKKGTVVSQPRKFFDETLVIDISTPVSIDNKNIGKLVVSIDTESLAAMFSNNLFQGDAALNLMTQDGIMIARISKRPSPLTPLSSVFDFYRSGDVQFLDSSIEDLSYAMSINKDTWIKYRYKNETVGVSFIPFGTNGWYMAIAATDNTLYAQSKIIQKNVWLLTLHIMLVVIIVSVFVIIQRVEEQKRIDALKNTYSIAIKKTNDLFYEADIDNDMFIDYSEQKDKTIWKDPPKNYSNALIQVANVCAPECRQQFLDTFLPQNIRIKMQEGLSSINFEYKITPDEHTERWLSATFVPIDDGDGTKLICMENDITEMKLKQESLKKSAIMDGLTGLYNRTTTKDSINRFLNTEEKEGDHALAIIDIDYFKQVNDNLGHLMGDEILMEFGQSLRKIFRKTDILGRVGGDEFVVFLKDYGVVELVMAKMKEVMKDLRKERFLEGNMDKSVRTSASIGVAFYGSDALSFDELYKAADTALYISKNAGRDQYTFYSPELEPSMTDEAASNNSPANKHT